MTKRIRNLLGLVAAVALAAPAYAGFSLVDDGVGVTVLEDGEAVLVYNHGAVEPETGDGDFADQYRRASYIHPLYGLGGDVITEDFPGDHPHHRGVFWTWPQIHHDGEHIDLWHLAGRQEFIEWEARNIEWGVEAVEVGHAALHAVNGWYWPGDETPFTREDVRFTVHSAEDGGRAIDFHFTFTNVSDAVVEIRGQSGAGYGGFNVRPDGDRPEPRFATDEGHYPDDATDLVTPWAAWSARDGEDGLYSGAAILPHPDNPTEPQPRWIFRHYGFLGASWPHDNAYPLEPGDSVDLRYRLYVFEGPADEAPIAAQYSAFIND